MNDEQVKQALVDELRSHKMKPEKNEKPGVSHYKDGYNQALDDIIAVVRGDNEKDR